MYSMYYFGSNMERWMFKYCVTLLLITRYKKNVRGSLKYLINIIISQNGE